MDPATDDGAGDPQQARKPMGGGKLPPPFPSRSPAASRNYEKLLTHYKKYILGFVIIIICPGMQEI
jgi:hypothetical protein